MKKYSVKTVNNVAADEQGNVNISTYKVYTALLTQSGGDTLEFLSSGPVTQGVTYYIDDSVGQDCDFTNVGSLPYPDCVFTYFVATNSDTPNNFDGILQYNAGAPIAIVLENTLSGTPTYEYVGEGSYAIRLNGEFIEDKTFFILGCGDDAYSGGGFIVTQDLSGRPDSLILTTSKTTDGIGRQNNLLYKTPIKIKVYN